MNAKRHTCGLALLAVAALSGCGGEAGQGPSQVPGQAPRRADGTIIDDRARCVFEGRDDVEVRETAGPGAFQPNVRRVWQVFGRDSRRREVLICREVDTNLDGYKDVVRRYHDDGQPKEERADANHDGEIDTWIAFGKGKVIEAKFDRNFDGKPDEWKHYRGGTLSRIKRDTDFDGKVDVWETYRQGRLERMGRDLDHDGRVDRWDHDTEWRRRLDAMERKKEEEAERKREERRKAAEDEPEDEAESD